VSSQGDSQGRADGPARKTREGDPTAAQLHARIVE
jgi:hypothetical protein